MAKSPFRARLMMASLLTVVMVCLQACIFDEQSSSDSSGALRIGAKTFTPEEIQANVMSFTDTYSALISQAFDELTLEDDTLDTRQLANAARVNWITNAIQIATSKNALTSLLDMTVMVTLQRQVWEEYWRPIHFGDDKGEAISRNLKLLEEEIWAAVGSILTSEQQSALRELIAQMRERYRGQVVVSSLRASDYAAERQQSLL